ncbi:MAG TPA: response regulator [Niastella sp.]
MVFFKHPKIILHVDDDPDDCFLVDQSLRSIDPSIILNQAQNGKKALNFLTQAKISGDFPCLIILDMNMPVMNGIDVYKEIRKDPALSEIPIVIFTTSIDDREVDYCKNENITLITKPDSFNEYIERIKKILAYSHHEP